MYTERYIIKYHGYADDTWAQMTFTLDDKSEDISFSIKDFVVDIIIWMNSNTLKLHKVKIEFVVVRSTYINYFMPVRNLDFLSNNTRDKGAGHSMSKFCYYQIMNIGVYLAQILIMSGLDYDNELLYIIHPPF